MSFGGGSPNLYVYVGDDPVNLVDPYGLVAGLPDWLLGFHDDGLLNVYLDNFAGQANVLTFGLAGKLIDATGLGKFGSKCSPYYAIGTVGGTALGLLMGDEAALVGDAEDGSALLSEDAAVEETGSGCADGLCTNNECFTAETLVDTEGGKKPISDVKVGDRVWSKNPKTGRIELEPVLRRYVNPDRSIVNVQALSNDGKLETLRVTPGHRFWVVGHGWTRARALAPGEQLLGENGAPETVLGEAPEGGTQTVYNLEVQSDHTYFVGPLGTWVHNQDCGGNNLLREAQERYPNKAGKIEYHHVTPKYLGGDPAGPTVPLDGAYHQMITNAFRAEWGYGQGIPSSEQLAQIMDRVYTQFPLP